MLSQGHEVLNDKSHVHPDAERIVHGIDVAGSKSR
jgi:hypothetical protein